MEDMIKNVERYMGEPISQDLIHTVQYMIMRGYDSKTISDHLKMSKGV